MYRDDENLLNQINQPDGHDNRRYPSNKLKEHCSHDHRKYSHSDRNKHCVSMWMLFQFAWMRGIVQFSLDLQLFNTRMRREWDSSGRFVLSVQLQPD